MQEIKEETYLTVRDGDVIVDNSERRWHVSGYYAPDGDSVSLYLGKEPGEKTHQVVKKLRDPVRVERTLSHAAEVAQREAEMPVFCDLLHVHDGSEGPCHVFEDTPDEVVKAVEEKLGGEVIAERTAEQEDAAAKATTAEPVIEVPFAEMTPMEMRSHIYALHGTFAEDVRTVAGLTAYHDDLHAGKVKSRTVPHVHR